jgi:hypothetical protein
MMINQLKMLEMFDAGTVRFPSLSKIYPLEMPQTENTAPFAKSADFPSQGRTGADTTSAPVERLGTPTLPSTPT